MDSWSTKIIIVLLGIQHHGLHHQLNEFGVRAKVIIPGLPKKQYAQLGDINIGALMSITNPGTDSLCSEVNYSVISARYPEVIAYAVERVNREFPLPHNLTLGFAVLDDCFRELVSAAQSLAFVPQTTCPETNDNGQTPYDVVAVIGSMYSVQSVAAALVLGPASVPQISVFSTADDLTTNVVYYYFMRVVPPDRFQFRAIFSFIQQYGWTYVSVLYSGNNYGENGFKQLKNLFYTNDVCLAAQRKLPMNLSDEEAKRTVKILRNYGNARVVVMILQAYQAHKVIKAAGDSADPGTFVWIASDSWSRYASSMTDLGNLMLGTVLVDIMASDPPEFVSWFKQRTPSSTSNPWFHDYWEKAFNCSLDNGTCDATLTLKNSSWTNDVLAGYPGYIIDTVVMIANATSRVLRSPDCRRLRGTAARACVTGPRLLSELKATQMNGHTGWLEVNANGDRYGQYDIKQLIPGSAKRFREVHIANFNSLTGILNRVGNVCWANHRLRPGFKHPQSLCSFPCNFREARVQRSPKCCWECNSCNKNERLVNNGAHCQSCEEFTWPSRDNSSKCVPITPSSYTFGGVVGAVQTSLASLCLLVCFILFIFFWRFRQCRVIKGSSVELSFFMLFGITIGYITLIIYLIPRTNFICRINFLLYCTSFTLVYGPLFVRTQWIYRRFVATTTSSHQPRMTKTGHNVLFVVIICSVQVGICSMVMFIHNHWHRLNQVSSLEPYVEDTCILPVAALVSILSLCLVLLAGSTWMTFKTRHLPDNFNETRFIAMCLCTTLVLSSCFIPAYFVTSQALLQTMIAVLALGLNHSMAVGFLFVPKIYAVLFLRDTWDSQQHTDSSVKLTTCLTPPRPMNTITSDVHFSAVQEAN